MKRIITLVLAFSFVLSCVPVFSEEAIVSWDDKYVTRYGQGWDFEPKANAKCEQNPPDFAWPYIPYASSYDLKVCNDKELTDIAYDAKGIEFCFYNFPVTFEKGKTYYWSVRFNSENGTSEWSEARRFTVLPEAWDYPLPDLNKIIDSITAAEHPRIASTKESLAEDRTFKDKYPTSKLIYDRLYSIVETYLDNGIIVENLSSSGKLNEWTSLNSYLLNTGFIYLISGEKRFGEFAKKQMLEVVSWGNESGIAYHHSDQNYRETLVCMAYCYDWLEGEGMLTPDEKKKTLEMLKEMLLTLEHPLAGLTSDSVYEIKKERYLSHGWTATIHLVAACIALVGDIPEADKLLREYLPMYINMTSCWSEEDGGYSEGSNYWSFEEKVFLGRTLYKLTGFDLYQKAWYKNNWKLPIYLMSNKLSCEFSDGSGNQADASDSFAMKVMMGNSDYPYVRWKYDSLGLSDTNIPMLYYYNERYENTKAEVPVSEPRSNLFKDIGIAAMHSDIVNDSDNISLYFRSSNFGAKSHSHADQNSFHIQAFGERLAIDSGYYDSVRTVHDKFYHRRTHAHNSITYDGGIGQAPYTGHSKGKIINFLNHPDFDLVSGDATQAYQYVTPEATPEELEEKMIGKFKRHMIYVRPDKFVVIDELAATEGKEVNFEWWLNAEKDISVYESRTGARITNGNAVLDAKIHYPKVTGFYSDLFSGPDLVHHPASAGYATREVHKRVWFKTPKLNRTKIITTMDVHRKNEDTAYVDSRTYNGYMLLTFNDGTKIYAATGDGEISSPKLKTDGVAVAVRGQSIMVIDATYLDSDGERIFTSDNKISLVLGKDEIGVSSTEDFNAEIRTGEVTKLMTPGKAVEEPESDARGFNWKCENGIMKVKGMSGYYSYYMNGKEFPGKSADNYELVYTVNGEEMKTTLTGYYNHDGEKVLSGKLGNEPGFYIVNDINNVNMSGASKGDTVIIDGDIPVMSNGVNASLSLQSLSLKSVNAAVENDHEKVKENADAFVEIEDFHSKNGVGKVYTTRAFLSGKKGMSGLDVLGESVTWELDVPETGKYDLYIKCVAWNGKDGVIKKAVSFNGAKEMISLNVHETGSFGGTEVEWVAQKFNVSAELTRGKNKLTLYALSGNWNLDWIALVKSE